MTTAVFLFHNEPMLKNSEGREYDKQSGRNTTALFIFFHSVAKAREKLFSEIDISCKKFLWEEYENQNVNDSRTRIAACFVHKS